MPSPRPRTPGWMRPLGWISRAGQFLFTLSFSSLTRRIVLLNSLASLALVAGILYLNQLRAGLIDARVQSLRVQGEIIAGAIAASATVRQRRHHHRSRPAAATSSPARRSRAPDERFRRSNFPINPERVAPVLRTLVSPTRTRARIYDPRRRPASSTAATCENVMRFDAAAAVATAAASSSAP